MTFKLTLKKLGACRDAVVWAGDKSLEEIWESCDRGDWMLWLYRKADNFDKIKITLAKGHCANTVRHLMKDLRSIAAVDAAIAYGNGEIDYAQLSSAYAAAYTADAAAAAAYTAAAAATAADTAAAYAAAAAAAAAAYTAAAAATAATAAADTAAAYTAAAATAAADAAAADAYAAATAATRVKNQKETADICRKYLSIPVFN